MYPVSLGRSSLPHLKEFGALAWCFHADVEDWHSAVFSVSITNLWCFVEEQNAFFFLATVVLKDLLFLWWREL